ncbi:AAA family ATPase [Exiguobacterium sp. s5]|uniref:ATP-dependent nuclease n=1 Tax=Exiguobacterium sp. s5 TaxID=2751239 RepID=UPI001BE9BCF9
MYLKVLRLWNWRKYSEKECGLPGIEIEFSKGLNVLIGENDAGKTAIIDAIKIILGTNSQEVTWITDQDFHVGTSKLKIECLFDELTLEEEAFFYEWLTFHETKSELRLMLEAEIYNDINGQQKIKKSIKAGPDGLEVGMEDVVRNLLCITYLKPLRDASSELSPGYRSRIAQVVKSLNSFKNGSEEQDTIISLFTNAFDELKKILDEPVLSKVGGTVNEFFELNNQKNPAIRHKEMGFSEILRKLELNLGELGTGLGSSNLLFMAVELLLLKEGEIGPKLALIEEIEAHIHPQAQLRVIKHFEKSSSDTDMQYIFTSHSPVLAASISLESIIFLYEQQAFSMKKGYTKLENDDYEFLERFLDATKANMFFAQGIIFVEGDAENLLLPAISEVIGFPLYKYGISIVNVGNLAFKRYSSIFLRNDVTRLMNFPVSIITDLDLKPSDYYDGPSYFQIDEDLNNKIANIYKVDATNNDLEGNYIQLEDLFKKSKTIYGKEIKKLDKVQQKSKFDIIHSELEALIANQESIFDSYKESTKYEIETRYFNNKERTKVFISSPWTLEHSILMSSLGRVFEEIILDTNYKDVANRRDQLEEWGKIKDTNLRATVVYNFLLKRNISKAVVAQKFAQFLIKNQMDLKDHLLKDDCFNHLVEAIKHVIGEE